MKYYDTHLDYLQAVADEDVQHVLHREQTYRGSWKASGGRSAWFMLRRKIDRLLSMMARPEPPAGFDLSKIRDAVVTCHEEQRYLIESYVSEDIFEAIEDGPYGDDGTVLAEVRDLRRYLLLVEAEMTARGVVAAYGAHESEDGALRTLEKAPLTVTEFVEQNAPGTPEDGGHHETLRETIAEEALEEPWILSTERGRLLPPEVWSTVYMAYHPLFRVLPPWISATTYAEVSLASAHLKNAACSRDILNAILGAYRFLHFTPQYGYVLIVDDVPSACRYMWPKMRRELNSREYVDILPWQQFLYEWRDEKFVLRGNCTAWCVDDKRD